MTIDQLVQCSSCGKVLRSSEVREECCPNCGDSLLTYGFLAATETNSVMCMTDLLHIPEYGDILHSF